MAFPPKAKARALELVHNLEAALDDRIAALAWMSPETKAAAKRLGKKLPNLAPEAANLLLRYAWPGNVRELENALERAVALATTDRIVVEDLPTELSAAPETIQVFDDIRTLEDRPAPRIVVNGAPMRGIAPCGSCHGDLDNKAGSPWLGGQSAGYFREQLRNFAAGERRNDINQQMRTIARSMTPEEMEAAALYYSGEAGPIQPLPR